MKIKHFENYVFSIFSKLWLKTYMTHVLKSSATFIVKRKRSHKPLILIVDAYFYEYLCENLK